MASTRKAGESIDYLTFVPDGEPILDVHLGSAIGSLKPLGIRIAVITNPSLIWREDVQWDLMRADWVLLKIDSVEGETWRVVNRPHSALRLDAILDGMLEFKCVQRGNWQQRRCSLPESMTGVTTSGK